MTRIDPLAHSTFDLFVKRIVDAKAQFGRYAEPRADTVTNTRTLDAGGTLADVERDRIRIRTADDRSRAQNRGQHMGRPQK